MHFLIKMAKASLQQKCRPTDMSLSLKAFEFGALDFLPSAVDQNGDNKVWTILGVGQPKEYKYHSTYFVCSLFRGIWRGATNSWEEKKRRLIQINSGYGSSLSIHELCGSGPAFLFSVHWGNFGGFLHCSMPLSHSSHVSTPRMWQLIGLLRECDPYKCWPRTEMHPLFCWQ